MRVCAIIIKAITIISDWNAHVGALKTTLNSQPHQLDQRYFFPSFEREKELNFSHSERAGEHLISAVSLGSIHSLNVFDSSRDLNRKSGEEYIFAPILFLFSPKQKIDSERSGLKKRSADVQRETISGAEMFPLLT